MPSPGHATAARLPADLRLLPARGWLAGKEAGTARGGNHGMAGGRQAGGPYRSGPAAGAATNRPSGGGRLPPRRSRPTSCASRCRWQGRAAPPRASPVGPSHPMMGPMPEIHDASFKLWYDHPRMVEDLLRGFVPANLVAAFDFGTLEQMPAQYVDEGLRQSRGDAAWRVRFRDAGSGGWLYLLVLLEFQSTIDRFMAARVLAYTGQMFLKLIRNGELAADGRLPPVLPVVIYNGRPRWSAAEEVGDTITAVGAGLAPFQPRQRYLLLDEHAQRVEDPSVGQRGDGADRAGAGLGGGARAGAAGSWGAACGAAPCEPEASVRGVDAPGGGGKRPGVGAAGPVGRAAPS